MSSEKNEYFMNMFSVIIRKLERQSKIKDERHRISTFIEQFIFLLDVGITSWESLCVILDSKKQISKQSGRRLKKTFNIIRQELDDVYEYILNEEKKEEFPKINLDEKEEEEEEAQEEEEKKDDNSYNKMFIGNIEITNDDILQGYCKGIESFLKRQKMIDDEMLRIYLMIDKILLPLDFFNGFVEQLIEKANGNKHFQILRKFLELFQNEMEFVYGWIQGILLSPDHPFGKRKMNEAHNKFLGKISSSSS